MKITREKTIEILFYAIVFGVLFVFWTRVSPLMVADADDWSYISYSRQAVPIWHGWNPSKVFPETFMGFCGYFAAYVIYPLNHDYIMAMTDVFAILTALFVVMYLYFFGRMIRKIIRVSFYTEIFCTGVFLAVHFLLLNSLENNNSYLLMGERLVCVTNYLWPMLLSASMVMYFLPLFIQENSSNCEVLNGCDKMGV